MNIIVLASCARMGGAVSIYRQFLNHLPDYIGENKYYIFVDSVVDQPEIAGVEYIIDNNHSYKHRLWFDNYGLKQWLKKYRITPDIIVSLQNTGVNVNCKQIIYYHQSLPFYSHKWNFFKQEERLLFLYKHIYPLFVKHSLHENTNIIVQIPFIRQGFVKRFNYDNDSVHVLFPDIEKIDIDKITPFDFDSNFYHFIYPANSASYKEHKTLIEAMKGLKEKNPALASKIKIHFTLTAKDVTALYELVCHNGLENNFVFGGSVAHNMLLAQYKASNGLLFPSTIETLGLPLLEAAAFGLPIIVSDLEYSREVIGQYEGACFVAPYDYGAWSVEIARLCETRPSFKPLREQDSSWSRFFELINKK